MLLTLRKNTADVLLSSSIVVLCWLSIFLLKGGIIEAAESNPLMEITVQDELITAGIQEVPLINVLERLQQEFSFKAHFHGDLTQPVSVTLTDVTLARCLRQLTANYSLSIVFKEGFDSQIAEIWVLGSGGVSQSSRKIAANPLRPVSADSKELPVWAENEQQNTMSFEEVLSNPDSGRSHQRQAIQELAEKGDPAAVMTMASFLDNEDKEVRELLVDGIGSINSEESTQVLSTVFKGETDPEIRKIALLALSKRMENASAQAIVKEAQNDSDEEVQILADLIRSR